MIHICDVCEFVARISIHNFDGSECVQENCTGVMRPLSELVELV